jgi:citrate synthase
MAPDQRYLTAAEAAGLLGISTATLYAYVSRGLLRSEAGDGRSRARRYLRADVEALLARKEYRREPAKAAEDALGFGPPVLDSAITLIEDGRLYYRGHDALELAQTRSFEEVAALLWTGDFATARLFGLAAHLPPVSGPPVSGVPVSGPPMSGPPLAAWPIDLANPIERCQAVLAQAAASDLAAHQLTSPAVAATGARILALAAQAITGAPAGEAPAAQAVTGAPPGKVSVAEAITGTPAGGPLALGLQAAWSPGEPAAAALISAALILCADHELNVSAFTARCVASAGSSPYAVVIAALSALQGFRHGGHTVQVTALLDAAAYGTRGAIGAFLRSGDMLSGFGHPLYPDGDPRARLLLALLGARLPGAPAVMQAGELCVEVYAALGLHPTIDLALAVLARAIGAPRHAPLALFALGRTAGWIAHACEQYALDQLIRPRARYVGVPPAKLESK